MKDKYIDIMKSIGIGIFVSICIIGGGITGHILANYIYQRISWIEPIEEVQPQVQEVKP